MKILPSLCHAQLRGGLGRVGMIITTYSIGIGGLGEMKGLVQSHRVSHGPSAQSQCPRRASAKKLALPLKLGQGPRGPQRLLTIP